MARTTLSSQSVIKDYDHDQLGLYFDGRKDRTLSMEDNGRIVIIEEHLSLEMNLALSTSATCLQISGERKSLGITLGLYNCRSAGFALEDDENDAVDPVFPCRFCGEKFALPSSLKDHERLRHGNKGERRDTTPQPLPSNLQSDAFGPRGHRHDSSPQSGASNLQFFASDSIRRSGNEIYPGDTIFKDLDFVKNEHNLNIVYKQHFSKEEADQIFDELEREIEYFSSEMATVVIYSKRYSVPRKVSAYGDKTLTYTFSGNTLPTKPLIPILTKILNKKINFLKKVHLIMF
ncbi:hypothetical protein AVEN_219202-1 [Araneus ventricosus]|uniref:C2H2-type domain-containing protein n=1 Tax=Araneus ventricosus TaxID=182803 RepID=A0A4Y2HWA4_ARAVE|nr:hypothetical protein AVEN_219202-1 [Araneus ventricosus]